MSSEQFSLCWDNFHRNMSVGMQSLLETEDLVDVTLAVEGRHLKAHKMVLSLCSPYFRELFQSNPCKHPIVFMKDVSYIALTDLLQFMYQGEVQVAQENLSTFIKTAEALQIKGLTGDNGGPNDTEVEQEIEKPVAESTKRSHDIELKPLTSRVKKFSGPASKRPKLSQTPTHPTSLAVGTKFEVAASANTINNVQSDDVNLKLEPTESTEHVQSDSLDETQIEQYADDVIGEDIGDDTEDFSLLESGTDEPKAGTSADAGDSQVLLLVPKRDNTKQKERRRMGMKRFRQAIKNDPVKYEEAKQKERERYYKRKELRKIKSIDQMTEHEKRVQRQQWKIRSQVCRKAKLQRISSSRWQNSEWKNEKAPEFA